MSPVDRARLQLTGTNFALGIHMTNFSPVSEMRKGQRSWGDEFWLQIRETKKTWRNTKILTFAFLGHHMNFTFSRI